MRKFLLLLVTLCTPVWAQNRPTSGAPNARSDIPAVAHKAMPAVVLVIAVDASGKELRQGSGFVVSSDGKVVTNNHVIEGAASAFIKFPAGAFYTIEGVLAVDKERDIAVVKAAGRDLPVLPLGSSQNVRVGEEVVAIGSPLALEATVSNGIVSAVRELKQGKLKVIQTTAPISRGSSGGVLLNLRGQVIGVTAFQLVPGENINFAISADYVKPLLVSNSVTAFHPQGNTAPESAGETGYKVCGCIPGSTNIKLFSAASDKTVVEDLICGEEVTVIGKEGGRLRLRSNRGKFGYVSELWICKKDAPEPNVQQTEKPLTLPREWINVEDGSAVNIRLEGDYLYEEAKFVGDGRYILAGSFICETKRQGGQWVGKCRYRVLLNWGGAITQNWCTYELDEVIKLVSPRRIAGESQEITPPTNYSDCPRPGVTRSTFALIPND